MNNRFADDDDDEEEEEQHSKPSTSTPAPPTNTLSQIGNIHDQDEDEGPEEVQMRVDKEEEQGEDAKEEEEEGDANGNQQGGQEQEQDDDEEEVEEEEEEAEEEDDRPRKKKRRKRTGNQFLDIEADVDEDEDEEEEEGEEGFVQGLGDFIENRPERSKQLSALNALGGIFDDDEGADFGDGDASHRLLDRRANAQKDKEAAELAASYRDRYGKARYDTEGAQDWAPKALLMPGVNDPSIWGIKCKTGRERELVLSLSRKAAALALSDNAAPLEIISAFQRDSIKGYIYVEARSEDHVRFAVNGLIGVYSNTPNGVFLVDIEEMPDLLRTKQKKVEIVPGNWVRIKRGKYVGDLAQVIDLSENGEEVLIKFIPRIDLTPKDEGVSLGPDGRKRKKGANGGNVSSRPPSRFFNPDEIAKVYGKKEISKRREGVYIFRGESYKDGYLEKDIKLAGLIVEEVQPTLDELTRFLGEAGLKSGMGGDGESDAGMGIASDLTNLAEASRKLAKSILQPGDAVEVFEGDQKGIYGTVDSISNDVVILTPHAELDLVGTKIEVQTRSVRKKFRVGDHVKVMHGVNADETGMVVKVKDGTVTLLSDLSRQEVQVFAKDVREAAEVGSGVNVIGQYELYDLVQLDISTTGVIFKIERDTFRILDQMGTIRVLRPSQIGIKANSRSAVAIDSAGYTISTGDSMKETSQRGMEPRTGQVLHIYKSIHTFLHNREYTENGGVFVTSARNLMSTAPRGTALANAKKMGQGLNPDRFGAAPIVNVGINARPDGRINRRVGITKGMYKGNTGFIKDVTGTAARVELHTNSKVITIDVDCLKESTPAGELIPLLERPGLAGPRRDGGGRGGFGGGGGYGGREGSEFSRDSSVFSTSANSSALGGGGKTPFPTGGYSGGRTPAPMYSGGRTPAPGTGATAGSWDSSSRTPAYQGGASSNAWNSGSRTPGYGVSDAFNPSSRTPHHPTSSTMSNASSSVASGAWNASSRTPRHPAMDSLRINDGGRTPDPRAGGGGRTPLYGAKSSTDIAGRGEGTSGSRYTAAPTPAANDWAGDAWGDSAPTPAAQTNKYPPRPPYDAPTPYTPAAGAPTPAPYQSSYPLSAPTPGALDAPTPGAYLGAPTPGDFAATPGGYSAPTPGPGNWSAPTPAAVGQTPAAYGQTPAHYEGAATAAAQPMEYVQRRAQQSAVPMDWPLAGLRVVFVESSFRNGGLNAQKGVVLATQAGGVSTVKLDSTGENVANVPTVSLQPIPPTRPGDVILVIGGAYRGAKGTAQAQDVNDWMVKLTSQQGPDSNPVLEQNLLCLAA